MAETPRSQLLRRITDPDTVKLVKQALKAEAAACPECRKGTPVAHSGVYPPFNQTLESATSLTQIPCRSGNRVWNQGLGALSGRAHCSCNTCFGS